MIRRILIFIVLLIFFASYQVVNGETDPAALQQQIATYEKEITRLGNQAATLSNQITQYDTQIKLTLLQISDTQAKITLLSGRIDQLETSLSGLTKAFSGRLVETYKMARLEQPIFFIASAPDIKTAVNRFYYLKKIQEADRDLLIRLQSAQTTYQGQKTDQEQLQTQLQTQKQNLDSQKKAKANLLNLTRNDEKRYQQLLASARAEFEAIQAILAGRGDETEVGKVSEGQRIASIIQGASCNSDGSHVHFIVSQGSTAQNPFNYLTSIQYENCSGSSCGSGDGDSFAPTGSWGWPISAPITFNQGFGSTWAVRNTWVGRVYSFHNGIDIVSSNSEVHAVKSGTLFRGSYGGTGGCRLRYVRVAHEGSDLSTFYLHINY